MPVLAVLMLALIAPLQATQHRYAEVVEGILALWDTADLVCLGEDHGRKYDSDLRIALVSHPDFVRTVDVIVVEFANPVHQDILDRFVLEGEEVPFEELARAWRNTSAPRVWDSPIYEAFLRAVREANLEVPREARVPVIGAAVPVDWERADEAEDLLPLRNRGSILAGAAEREVLAAKRKGLGIYGAGHCGRRRGFTSGLDHKYPGRARGVFAFFGTEGAVEGRRALGLGSQPRLVPVRDTDRATLPASGMFFTGSFNDRSSLGDVVDAIVYHGEVEDLVVRADPNLYQGAYLEELRRREKLHAEFAEMVRRRFPGVEDED